MRVIPTNQPTSVVGNIALVHFQCNIDTVDPH